MVLACVRARIDTYAPFPYALIIVAGALCVACPHCWRSLITEAHSFLLPFLSQVLLCDDLMAFAALVPDKKKVCETKQNAEQSFGHHGATVGELTAGHAEMARKFLMWKKGVREVIKRTSRDSKYKIRSPCSYRLATNNHTPRRWLLFLTLMARAISQETRSGRRPRSSRSSRPLILEREGECQMPTAH